MPETALSDERYTRDLDIAQRMRPLPRGSLWEKKKVSYYTLLAESKGNFQLVTIGDFLFIGDFTKTHS